METIQKTMTFERAKCVGRSLYGNMQYAICYCHMLSNRNETKWNAVAKSHLKMHNKNLFIGLDPVSVAWLHIRLVSSRLGSTLLASRGSMLCKPGSLFYIYFSSFFSHFFFTTHIIRSTYYTKTQITQQIFTDAVNRNRFNFPHRLAVSLLPSLSAAIYPSLSVGVYVDSSYWFALAALHSKDASCGPDPIREIKVQSSHIQGANTKKNVARPN